MCAKKRTVITQVRSSAPTTVLVVDNDLNQIDSICRGLFLFGYRCVKKTIIGDALDLLNRPDGPEVDLLITDITTPGNHGFRLIRHVRALYPDLPIIAVCGHNAISETEIPEEEGVLILMRPFNPKRLNGAIRDMVA
ncbi:MAG: response regulator [Proteobacteria bacterium]|nr:response regulator [Pseudomonadota bacterium]